MKKAWEGVCRGITKNVFVVSVVSFFNDIASEMIYPIVPVFLTAVLGAPVTVVGLVEGVAESTASVLRIFSGWFSDKLRSRKRFMVIGYGLSAFSKLVLASSFHWSMVLGGRFLDRSGKGIRTSARDALIAESSEKQFRGRVFGFHRALDTMGALLGPLMALALLSWFGNNLRFVLYLSLIPAVTGLALLVILVKDTQRQANGAGNPRFWLSARGLTRDFKVFLIVSVVFAMGNSSDAFLILRAGDLGFPLGLTVAAYSLFNLSYAVSSHPAGMISDKIGQKRILLAGFCLFGVVYFLFGVITNKHLLWILFPLYGIYMALTEGVGRAYISLLVDDTLAATAYGIYQTVVGVVTFFSSLIAGLLWTHIAPGAPFLFGSMTALAAFIIFAVSMRSKESSL